MGQAKGKFVQIGVTALRDDKTGAFLPAQPIYVKVLPEEINPDTGMIPQEEKTLNSLAKIFAEKFGQYVRECKTIGLKI